MSYLQFLRTNCYTTTVCPTLLTQHKHLPLWHEGHINADTAMLNLMPPKITLLPTLWVCVNNFCYMTPTHQALLPSRCSRITGQVVQQAVEMVRLGALNRTAGCSCKQGFLTLAKMHVKTPLKYWSHMPFFQRLQLCNCISISYKTIRCY